MRHKSRKELRLEASTAAQELAQLKTPEGIAAYLYAKKDDEAFADALNAELSRLEGPPPVIEESDQAAIEAGEAPPLL